MCLWFVKGGWEVYVYGLLKVVIFFIFCFFNFKDEEVEKGKFKFRVKIECLNKNVFVFRS